MYRVLIVHGSFGTPYENWFPWLYEKLSELNVSTLVPHFPSPDGQNYTNWEKVMNSYEHLFNSESIIVAHSLAPAFVTDYLIENEKNVKGVIYVAPFYGLINLPDFDEINRSFFIDKVELENLKNYTEFRHCIYSDNDPYVPTKMSDNFSDKISASVEIIKKGKHLNKEAGFDRFEILLDRINEYI